jgi:predicted ArsR family transcriptional regulator
VLEALRGGARTVNALAARLGVTDNGVRVHLAALERDGFVRVAGSVQSGVAGKPAIEYEVTREAEIALSRAYAPALEALVAALDARLEPRALRAALVDAGHRIAPPPVRATSLAARAHAALELLTSLGASARLEPGPGRSELLRGNGCPLAAAVARVPATCTLVEAMLAAHTGLEVGQQCAHDGRPRCAFRLSKPAAP